jgi:hypothetical protein
MDVTGENTEYQQQAFKVGELWVGGVRLTGDDLAKLINAKPEKPETKGKKS